jgi:transcription initiation factor TFIID subunit 5
MSVTTPAASSQSPGVSSPANAASLESASNVTAIDRVIVEYLRARGHTAAEQALLDAIDDTSSDGKGKQSEATTTITAEDLVKKLAVYAQRPSRPGENVLKDPTNVLQELSVMGNPANIQSLIASIGSVGAEEILSLDPTDKHEGFRELEAWVDGSLDMYRVRRQFALAKFVFILKLSTIARIQAYPVPYFLSLLPGPDSIWIQRSG